MKEDKVVRTDKGKHTELAVMAARKKVTIGTVVKQLVDAEKERNESESKRENAT